MAQNTTYEGPLMVRGKGTGFFAVEGFDEDILIPTESLGFALDGDIVEVELKKKVPGRRQEGTVVRVIERTREEIIGTVKKSKAPGFELLPDNTRIHVRPLLDGATALDEGMKVAAKITLWKDPSLPPRAVIIETLGKAGEHETEMQAIIRQGGFSENFNEVVSKAGQELYARREELFAAALAATEGEDPSRRDMRDRTTMTIDPADAKDFDDALSVHKNEDGTYEIGIHIADVSYYVKENDPIDKEAQERGTSIYLVDRVIPMLPEVLSNDLCSLRPNEDRLAFSAVFTMNDKAEILSSWYGQTIIHSDRRFSYEEAQDVLDRNEGDNLAELTTLMTLGRILRKHRFEQGAIAFEQPEVRFKLDENGKPIEVVTKIRTETMMMIEDFMLLANQKVTEHIYHLCRDKGRDAAFIYRVHDVPNPEKIEELSLFIHALGYEFETDRGEVKATEINKLLKSVEGTPEENLIKTATIRSMAKAIYSTKNIGHFGLAFKYYTHFTSPIRRYPDLMAHRMLRRHLDGSAIGKQEMLRYEKLAIKSSAREIEAVKAERDSIKFKQVEFMLEKVGQEFDGIITGVTDWGIYVEEKESKAEGMVRLASIKGDYFVHDASKYRVRGEKSGRSLALGEEVRFRIVRADLQERQLDFELVEKK